MINQQENAKRLVDIYRQTAALILAKVALLDEVNNPKDGILGLVKIAEETTAHIGERFKRIKIPHSGSLEGTTYLAWVIVQRIEETGKQFNPDSATIGEYMRYRGNVLEAAKDLRVVGEITQRYTRQ